MQRLDFPVSEPRETSLDVLRVYPALASMICGVLTNHRNPFMDLSLLRELLRVHWMPVDVSREMD